LTAGRPALRWGIISTAKIGASQVVPAIQALPDATVAAVASRDLATAERFGAERGIPRCYGSYEQLLADPDIDAVYNPLPNHLHGPITLAAARAGKHVLTEKPLTLDAAEAAALVADLDALNNGVVVMEAFMYQFHPQWVAVLNMIKAGRIGRVRAVQTWFSYFGDDPANIRHVPEWGGGALMDIGCYAINSARRIFDAEPERATGSLTVHPTYGVDVIASAVLEFPGGGQASFTVATQADPTQRMMIVGEAGRIELTRPFNPQNHERTVVRVGAGLGADFDEPLEELTFGPAPQYGLMADAFAAAIRDGRSAPVPLSDAVANMTVIDRIRQSAQD